MLIYSACIDVWECHMKNVRNFQNQNLSLSRHQLQLGTVLLHVQQGPRQVKPHLELQGQQAEKQSQENFMKRGREKGGKKKKEKSD